MPRLRAVLGLSCLDVLQTGWNGVIVSLWICTEDRGCSRRRSTKIYRKSSFVDRLWENARKSSRRTEPSTHTTFRRRRKSMTLHANCLGGRETELKSGFSGIHWGSFASAHGMTGVRLVAMYPHRDQRNPRGWSNATSGPSPRWWADCAFSRKRARGPKHRLSTS